MALRRRFLPVFKKHAPRGKPRFAKPLQGHFGPAAKHSQKHKNRPKIGRFSHFNPSAEMHPFSLFSASKAPQKWLCDAICRKKQLFAGSFGSRSHSFCSFTAGALYDFKASHKKPSFSVGARPFFIFRTGPVCGQSDTWRSRFPRACCPADNAWAQGSSRGAASSSPASPPRSVPPLRASSRPALP